jgi:hypothetical protein
MVILIMKLIFSTNLLLILLAVSALIITLLILQIPTQINFGIVLKKSFVILSIFLANHVNMPPFYY